MARQIVKQPNGKYALWCSVVDDFTLLDCTPAELIDELTAQRRQEIEEMVMGEIAKLEAGKKTCGQFTMTFEKAVKTIRAIHGKNAETLKHFGLAK